MVSEETGTKEVAAHRVWASPCLEEVSRELPWAGSADQDRKVFAGEGLRVCRHDDLLHQPSSCAVHTKVG